MEGRCLAIPSLIWEAQLAANVQDESQIHALLTQVERTQEEQKQDK